MLVLHHKLLLVVVSFLSYCLSKIALSRALLSRSICALILFCFLLWPFISYTNRNCCSWKKEFVGDLNLGIPGKLHQGIGFCAISDPTGSWEGLSLVLTVQQGRCLRSWDQLCCAITRGSRARRRPSLAQHLLGKEGAWCNYWSLGWVFRADSWHLFCWQNNQICCWNHWYTVPWAPHCLL